MPVPVTNVWPRRVSIHGSDRWSSILGAFSTPGTCGTFCFETDKGHEAYLYINGTSPMTLMFGGVTEVMTNPAGGTAIGSPITPVGPGATPSGVRRIPPGWAMCGTERVSSAVLICPAPGGAAPAIGLMNNNGNDIKYLYVTDDGTMMTLNVGTEAQWLANTVMGTPIATIAQSGARGRYVEGRTILVDAPGPRSAMVDPVAVVVRSGGLSGAIGLMSGDLLSGVAISYDPGASALRYDAVQNWYSWSGANAF